MPRAKAAALSKPAPVTDSAATSTPIAVSFRPVLNMSDDTFVYYANYAEVGQSPAEFSITFGRMPTKMTPDQMTEIQIEGTITIDAPVQILLPASTIVGLIDALRLQYQTYLATIGPVASGEIK